MPPRRTIRELWPTISTAVWYLSFRSARSAMSAWRAATMVRHIAKGKPISVSRRRPTLRSVALPGSPQVNQLQNALARLDKSGSISTAERTASATPRQVANAPKTRKCQIAVFARIGLNGPALDWDRCRIAERWGACQRLGTRENPRVARRSHRLPALRHSTNVLLYWIGHGTVRNEGVLGQRVVPSGGFS